jgi:hypothetical protein
MLTCYIPPGPQALYVRKVSVDVLFFEIRALKGLVADVNILSEVEQHLLCHLLNNK